MFRTLGPPSLFVTLSADDLHQPAFRMTLKKTFSMMNLLTRVHFFLNMRSDPLITAIRFERRLTELLEYILNGKTKPLGEI